MIFLIPFHSPRGPSGRAAGDSEWAPSPAAKSENFLPSSRLIRCSKGLGRFGLCLQTMCKMFLGG